MPHYDVIAPEAVREQLQKILESPIFSQAGRLRRFLEYVVERTLCGETHHLKEYTIGLAVFDRPAAFDSRLDPIVRVEAGRLRQKLNRYNETDGVQQAIRIELPKGAYVPLIELQSARPPTVAKPRPALAILPFADLSIHRDQAYLCEGMTEELIRALTLVPGLQVFGGKSRATASFILEGGVRRDEDRLRITAKLKEVKTGQYLWAENYDHQLSDVFAIQEDISRAIAAALQVHLTGEPGQPLVLKATENTIAYRLYLKARYFWNLRTADGLLEAVRLFQKAVENDPKYGLAYSGLADSYSLLGNYGVLSPSEVRKKAILAAENAVQLAPELAEAHTSRGHVLATCEWNWEEAEREYETAIELNPRLATSHHWYAITCLMSQRRLGEAQLEIMEAAALDPVSVSIARDVAVVAWARRDYAGAKAQAQRVLELDPNFHEAYWILGLACEMLAQFDQAIAAFERGRALRPTARLIGAMGHCLALAGRTEAQRAHRAPFCASYEEAQRAHRAPFCAAYIEDAHRALATLKEFSQERYVSPFDSALVWLGLGESDRALEWLGRALQDHCYELLWLPVDPRWDALRTHARYQAIVQLMHAPDATQAMLP
ncbi:MAG: tetratricopeptide repeat protein [Bryobacteraceae bacterium]